MAISSKDTLSNPPYNEKIIDQNGNVSLKWMRWYMDLMKRVGGYNGRSATQLQDSIESNTGDITTLDQNIKINANNISTLNGLIGELQTLVDTIQQTQNNDHESIVSNSTDIANIKTDLTSAQQKINTNTQDIDTIETNVSNLSTLIDNLPFKQVSTLPTGNAYINKFVYYTSASSICYSINGTEWRKISDNTIVT